MLAAELRQSKGFSLFVVCIAVFTDVFVYGLVVPVMPFALTQRMGVPEEDVQMWNSVLLGILGFAIVVGAITFGYISDRLLSRRLPFTLGLGFLGSATVMFALARTLVIILVARFLQGLATAMVFTVGYALLFDKVGSEAIGHAMGWTSLSLSLGWFLGPVIGGIIYERVGYWAVFALPLFLVVMEIGLRLLVIESAWVGTTARNSEDEEAGTASPSPLPVDETQPLLGPKIIKKSVHRNAILVLMGSPRFLVGMTGFCIMNIFMVAFDGVLPVYIKELFLFNSQQVALTFLSLTFPMLLSPVFGSLVDKWGSTKWPAVAGLVLSIPGLLLLRLVNENTTTDLILLVVLLVELSLSFAVGMPPFASEVMFVVEDIEKREPGIFGPHGAIGQAYGLTNAGLGVGCMLGPLVVGYVRVQYGWDVAVTGMAALGAISLLFVVPITGGPLWKTEEKFEVIEGQ